MTVGSTGGRSTAGSPDARERVAGAVLCGGRSRRMGTDKARLVVRGRTLLERALEALDPLCERVLLACGPEARYGELGRPLALDRFPGSGPLAGLHAALSEMAAGPLAPPGRPAEWLVCLACDMPRADTAVLARLLERARARGLDACLLETEPGAAGAGGLEPLYAVYRASCLAPVEAALRRGERRMVAFHGDVVVGTLRESELEGPRGSAVNVNTPAELGGPGRDGRESVPSARRRERA